MAEISYVATTRNMPSRVTGSGIIHIFTWTNVTESDTCQPVEINGKAVDAIIQLIGGAGGGDANLGGATMVVDGILDPDGDNEVWENLPDVGNTAISMTAEGMVGLGLIPTRIRPTFSSGSSQDADIVLMVRML